MKKRVLLIGREPAIREILCKKMKMQGHDVRWAANTQDELLNADFLQTDLLLIDLDVPPAEGLGILSRMAALNPGLEVIGLTERTDQPPVAFGSRLSAIVEKPIDLEGMFRLMEELLTQVREDRGEFRLVPRKSFKLPDTLRRRAAEPNICPAAYSGWGINE